MNHSEPDRVPVDFSGHRSSGISAIAYNKLRKYMGLPDVPVRIYDPVQQLAIVNDDVLDIFGVDTIELGRAFALEDDMWTDWVLPDGTPCQLPVWIKPERVEGQWVVRSKTGNVTARMPDGCLYFEQVCYPFAEKDDLDAMESAMDEVMWVNMPCPPGPLADGPLGFERLSGNAQKLRRSTDRAIVGLFGGSLFENGQNIYRNDNFFLLLAGEPERAHEFLDRLVEIHLRDLKRFLDAVGDNIDVIGFGDDFGMQTGSQISPEMYRRFFKPRHKLMWDYVKRVSKAKIMLHSCGSIRALLPDLIDAGLDAVNPVQVTCSGMDAASLKAEFGKDMVFWGGGCDTREILPFGSPESIGRHVCEQIEILSKGGGFIFQQVHNILANVPPQNVAAMFKAVHGEDCN